MKQTLLSSVVALMGAGAFASAHADAASFVDRARVRDVQPQYETVQVPRDECSSRWVTESRPVAGSGQVGGAILGGTAGAILGAQVGKGSGRDAAIAAGAAIGAVTGDRMGREPPMYEQAQREVRECRTVYGTSRRLTGYRVVYEYRGNDYTTITREQPGATLAVRVSLQPIE